MVKLLVRDNITKKSSLAKRIFTPVVYCQRKIVFASTGRTTSCGHAPVSPLNFAKGRV